jgi:hypothetical protein
MHFRKPQTVSLNTRDTYVDIAVWNVVHEERPEEVSSDDRIGHILPRFDDVVKGLERGAGLDIAGPVVLASQVRLVLVSSLAHLREAPVVSMR